MSKAYLYEFLYRGRSDGTGDFHVQLAVESDSELWGGVATATQISPAMTPAQAEAAGYDLPKMLKSFDKALHAEIETLRPKVEQLEKELQTERDAHEQTRAAAIDSATERDMLAEKLAIVSAQIDAVVQGARAPGDRIQPEVTLGARAKRRGR